MDIYKTIENKRKKYFTIIASLGILIFLLYVLVNIYVGDYGDSLFEFILALILVISIILIRYDKIERVGLILGSLVMYVISIHNFVTGGFDGTGIFWLIVFPVIVFMLRGSKRGAYWSLLLILTIAFITLLNYLNYLSLPYNLFYSAMFLMSFSVLTLFNYIHQRNQETYQKIIEDQSIKLSMTLEKSKKDLKEIEEKRKSLEKLNKLMTGRELQMTKLKKQIAELKNK